MGQMMYQQTMNIKLMNFEKYIVYDIPTNGDSLMVIHNKISGKLECHRRSIFQKSLTSSVTSQTAPKEQDFLK
jgi:formamidopyrimidine-DNA glycosylase